MPAMFFVGNFSYVLVIIVSAALMLEGHISITIVAFMVYVRAFSQPCRLPKGLPAYNKPGAMTRVFEFLSRLRWKTNLIKTQLTDTKGEVVFDQSFLWILPERTIVHDFLRQLMQAKDCHCWTNRSWEDDRVNLLMKFYEVDKEAFALMVWISHERSEYTMPFNGFTGCPK